MMVFQVEKGRPRLVLLYCSADSDNSKLIKKDSKIGPMYQAAMYPWEKSHCVNWMSIQAFSY